MGGDLTVAQRSQSDNTFKVKVDQNVTIQNFKGNGKLNNLDSRAVVKNGKVNISFKWKNQPKATAERAMNLSSTEYNMFDTARKADQKDKKGGYLTRSDLQALKNNKALQKKNGLTVRADEKAGAYTLVSNDGKSTLSFKFF